MILSLGTNIWCTCWYVKEMLTEIKIQIDDLVDVKKLRSEVQESVKILSEYQRDVGDKLMQQYPNVAN